MSFFKNLFKKNKEEQITNVACEEITEEILEEDVIEEAEIIEDKVLEEVEEVKETDSKDEEKDIEV
ncbi:MAG: hypothetical protein AAGU14_07675 [Eubacteriaceae bacterium]